MPNFCTRHNQPCRLQLLASTISLSILHRPIREQCGSMWKKNTTNILKNIGHVLMGRPDLLSKVNLRSSHLYYDDYNNNVHFRQTGLRITHLLDQNRNENCIQATSSNKYKLIGGFAHRYKLQSQNQCFHTKLPFLFVWFHQCHGKSNSLPLETNLNCCQLILFTSKEYVTKIPIVIFEYILNCLWANGKTARACDF